MEPRYLRNVPALTREECALLRTKKIAVIGCGGLGGHLIDLLARLGIGSILAVDGDIFDASNLNRQLLSQVSLLGTEKARAAADRVRMVNPDVKVRSETVFLDNIPSRKILSAACEKANIPYIYGAIQGWVAQAGISMPGDHLIDTLYPEEIEIRDKSVLSFTPALCASMQASLCVKLLAGRPVETGTVYYFDLLNQEFETIPLV